MSMDVNKELLKEHKLYKERFMITKNKIYMSKSPVMERLPYVYILYRELTPSFKKNKSEYHYKLSFTAIYFSAGFFFVGLSIFRPSVEPSFLSTAVALIMIIAAIFQWFYIKSKGSHFNLLKKRFYTNQGLDYHFDEIKAFQLLEYGEDTDIRRVKYQLNLVLDGLTMNRILLMEDYSLSFMRKELQKLSDLLDKPAFDITTGEVESRKRFLLRLLFLVAIIFFMFYISVGHMFFPTIF